jgi:hypothetical protein
VTGFQASEGEFNFDHFICSCGCQTNVDSMFSFRSTEAAKRLALCRDSHESIFVVRVCTSKLVCNSSKIRECVDHLCNHQELSSLAVQPKPKRSVLHQLLCKVDAYFWLCASYHSNLGTALRYTKCWLVFTGTEGLCSKC